MWDVIFKIFLVFLGAGIGHYLAKARGRRLTLKIVPFFHRGLIGPVFSPELPDNMEVDVKELVEELSPGIEVPMFTALYVLTNTGNETIKDCDIVVRAKKPTEIGHAVFYVDQELICRRMIKHEVHRDRFEAHWKYINPGETLMLYVAAAGSENFNDLLIEADAEGMKLCRSRGSERCSIGSIDAKVARDIAEPEYDGN